jgi:hypothetical protein
VAIAGEIADMVGVKKNTVKTTARAFLLAIFFNQATESSPHIKLSVQRSAATVKEDIERKVSFAWV